MDLTKLRNTKARISSPVRYLLGIGLSVGSLVAVGWFAYNAVQSGVFSTGVRWAFFVPSVLVQFALVAVLPFFWQRLLRSLWPDFHSSGSIWLLLLRAYSRSWLARYIPGRVWMFGGRLLWGQRLGVPAAVLARSMGFEVLFSYGLLTLLGASLLLGVLVHPLMGVGMAAVGALSVFISPLLLKVVRSMQESRGGGLLAGAFRRLAFVVIGEQPVPTSFIWWAVVAYGLHAVLQLVFIVLLAFSFLDLSVAQAVTVAGAWAISSVAGYMFFLSPAGLGVRDGVALGLFIPAMGAPAAGALVAASRIIFIGVDLAFVALVEVVTFRLKATSSDCDQGENHSPGPSRRKGAKAWLRFW